MTQWHARLRLSLGEAKLLLSSEGNDDLLKARLPTNGLWPNHPRALLTLLEGLALWSGTPLCVAVSVDKRWGDSSGVDFFEQTIWPEESALVQFIFATPQKDAYRLRGLGNFRDLRQGLPQQVIR